MIEKNINITAKDGFEIGACIREPRITPKGLVQINSGTGILQTFYRHFAKYLTNLGYVTITYDYRGIGDSKPKTLRGFKATNIEWATLDMSAVFAWSIETYPVLEKIMIGHSMGGQLIGFMEQNEKIDRVILIASGTGYWRDMPNGMLKNLTPLLWYLYIPLSLFFFGYANAKKIRQGENLPKGVALQWRKWCLNEHYWEEEFDNLSSSFARLTAPIKSLFFLDDTFISRKANKQLLNYYSKAKINEIEIAPHTFGFNKIGHFGYFSKEAESLWASLI